MEADAAPDRLRVAWLDAAKAWGMYLVFYGHFVERVAQSDNHAAFLQQKLVYAFHVPLFVLLSGLVAKKATEQPGLVTFLKRKVASRLVPVVFFSVLMAPFVPLESLLEDYLPTGSGLVRSGWIGPEWGRRLVPPADGEQAPARRTLWQSLSPAAQDSLRLGAAGQEFSPAACETIADAVNQSLARPDLFSVDDFPADELSDRNRAWLESDRSGLDVRRLRSRNAGFMWVALFPEWAGDDGDWYGDLKYGLVMTFFRGFPELAVPTWFLVCLFVLEVYHFAVSRLLTSRRRIAVAVVAFFAVGWLANMSVSEPWTDVWFLRENLFLYAFYLMGFLLRDLGILERHASRWWGALALLAGGAVLWLTYDLNSGSRFFAPVVLVNLSQHGDLLYFTVTALAGCLATVGLAQLSAAWGPVVWIGRHSLIFMGLNSFFFAFANHNLVNALGLGAGSLEVLVACTAVTVASLALSAVVAGPLDRYLPQLVGRPQASGPLLPPLGRPRPGAPRVASRSPAT